MAKLIFNGMEIADVTYSSGGGGGGMPTFTETVIATGTSGGTVTFTEDYHDYPLIVIQTANTSSDAVYDIIVSPDLLDSIFDIGQDLVINEFSNNQYGNYRNTSSTVWTRQSSRNVYISKVVGLTCDNYTVSETEIYNKGSYDTQSRAITGTNLLSYDLLLVASSIDGIQPNSINCFNGISSDGYMCLITPYADFYRVRVTDTGMSSAPYHYVSGIKFT